MNSAAFLAMTAIFSEAMPSARFRPAPNEINREMIASQPSAGDTPYTATKKKERLAYLRTWQNR